MSRPKETDRIETYFTRQQLAKLAAGQQVTATVGEEHDGLRWSFRLVPLTDGSLRIVARRVEWDHGGAVGYGVGGYLGKRKMGVDAVAPHVVDPLPNEVTDLLSGPSSGEVPDGPSLRGSPG